MMKKILIGSLSLLILFSLTGCEDLNSTIEEEFGRLIQLQEWAKQVENFVWSKNIARVEKFGCRFIEGKDRDHCIQDAAIRGSDADRCDQILAADFTEMQWPAPRDKCYLLIAEKTGDSSVCKNIVWGLISYSQEECYAAAEKTKAEMDEEQREKLEQEEEQNEDEDERDGEEGECKYDSDCDAICEDNVYRKMWCNPRTNTCEKTFDTDCIAERTSIWSFTFAKQCTLEGCVDDKERIAAFRDSLSADALKFQNLMQEVERARVQAHDNCLSALSDVTNKFIIDSAIMFAGVAGLRSNMSYQSSAQFSKYVQPSGSSVESLATAQVTWPVQNLLDTLGSMAIDDGKPKMKVEDYIDLNCNAAKDLAVEHARLAQERDTLIELAKPMKGW